MDILPTFYNNYLSTGSTPKNIIIDFNCIINYLNLDLECFSNLQFYGGYEAIPENEDINKDKINYYTIFNNTFPINDTDVDIFKSNDDDYQTFYNIAMFFSYIINLNHIACTCFKDKSRCNTSFISTLNYPTNYLQDIGCSITSEDTNTLKYKQIILKLLGS